MTGDVRLKLYKSNCEVVGAKSPYSFVGDVVKMSGTMHCYKRYYNEWREYFDSRCFKLHDNKYYLSDKKLEHFIKEYCEEMLSLLNLKTQYNK